MGTIAESLSSVELTSYWRDNLAVKKVGIMLIHLLKQTIRSEARQLVPLQICLTQPETIWLYLGQARMLPECLDRLDRYRLIVTLTHREIFCIDQYRMVCEPLTILLVAPGQQVWQDLSDDDHHDAIAHLVLTVKPTFLRNILHGEDAVRLATTRPVVIEPDALLYRVLLSFMGVCRDREQLQHELLNCIIRQFMLQLKPHVEEVSQIDRINDCSLTAVVPENIQQSFQYLTAHYDQPVRLSHLAALSGLSVNYLIKQFNQHYGMSPHRMLVHVRVKRASLLLSVTNLPASQISAQCGFCSGSHFAAAFHEETGLTPIQYRKQYRMSTLPANLRD